MNLQEIVLSINTAVLTFVVVDYIKFRVNFHTIMKQNYVQKEVCNSVKGNITDTLQEIKAEIKELGQKIDELR